VVQRAGKPVIEFHALQTDDPTPDDPKNLQTGIKEVALPAAGPSTAAAAGPALAATAAAAGAVAAVDAAAAVEGESAAGAAGGLADPAAVTGDAAADAAAAGAAAGIAAVVAQPQVSGHADAWKAAPHRCGQAVQPVVCKDALRACLARQRAMLGVWTAGGIQAAHGLGKAEKMTTPPERHLSSSFCRRSMPNDAL